MRQLGQLGQLTVETVETEESDANKNFENTKRKTAKTKNTKRKPIQGKINLRDRIEELDVCTNLWAQLTNLGLGAASNLKKQVVQS